MQAEHTTMENTKAEGDDTTTFSILINPSKSIDSLYMTFHAPFDRLSHNEIMANPILFKQQQIKLPTSPTSIIQSKNHAMNIGLNDESTRIYMRNKINNKISYQFFEYTTIADDGKQTFNLAIINKDMLEHLMKVASDVYNKCCTEEDSKNKFPKVYLRINSKSDAKNVLTNEVPTENLERWCEVPNVSELSASCDTEMTHQFNGLSEIDMSDMSSHFNIEINKTDDGKMEVQIEFFDTPQGKALKHKWHTNADFRKLLTTRMQKSVDEMNDKKKDEHE